MPTKRTTGRVKKPAKKRTAKRAAAKQAAAKAAPKAAAGKSAPQKPAPKQPASNTPAAALAEYRRKRDFTRPRAARRRPAPGSPT